MLVGLTVSAQPIAICVAQAKSEPVTIVSHVDIIPDAYKLQSEENAARLLRGQKAESQHDDGLISYIVLQQSEASDHFTIIETWRDTRSYEMHQGADHTVEFRREIQPFWVVRSTPGNTTRFVRVRVSPNLSVTRHKGALRLHQGPAVMLTDGIGVAECDYPAGLISVSARVHPLLERLLIATQMYSPRRCAIA